MCVCVCTQFVKCKKQYTSALVMVGFDGWCLRQAHLTFAMARHAVVDLAQVFSVAPPEEPVDRLADGQFDQLMTRLQSAGLAFEQGDVRERLAERRAMYEPYIAALSAHLALPLPEWNRTVERPDNWEGAPWKTKRNMEHF